MNRLPRNAFSYLVLCLLGCLLFAGSAIAQPFVNSEIPFNQYGIQTVNPYVVNRFIWNGELVDKVIVPSRPPGPIKGEVVSVPQPNIAAGTSSLSKCARSAMGFWLLSDLRRHDVWLL